MLIQHRCSIEILAALIVLGKLPGIRVSSAYCAMGNSTPPPLGKGKDKIPLCRAELIMLCNRSATNINRRGDKGSPYLTPPPSAVEYFSRDSIK
jgi:hypothetical protein